MRRSKYFSLVMTILVIVGIIAFMTWALIIRDYTITTQGGSLTLVARISVPAPSSVTVDTSEEERLTVKCTNMGAQVHSYEFQISRFKNMAFAKVYGTEQPKQTIAGLKGGKKYYVRARCIKLNESSRRVLGRWTSVHAATVKKKDDKASVETPIMTAQMGREIADSDIRRRKISNDVRVKRYVGLRFASVVSDQRSTGPFETLTIDSQHAHFVCNVLLCHSYLPCILYKMHYDIRVRAGHKVSNHCAST